MLINSGMAGTNKFISQASRDLLEKGSREEIINAARNLLMQGNKVGVSDAIFSKSNAKRLSNILNGGIDFVENKTKAALIRSYANLNNRKLADTLKTLSSPGSATAGKEGIDVLGIEVGGKFIAGKARSKAYNKSRDVALEALRLTVVPKNKAEAFAGAYVRGFLGETTATAATSVLIATPRSVLAAPQARTFVKTLQNEVEFLRTSGQVKSASQLSRAIKNATGAARDVYGSQEGLISSQVAGYVTGRLTVPVASTYIFVDKDERKKRIDKLQSSITPWAKKEAKIWVDKYTRQDGTKVSGYYKQVELSR